MIIILFRYNALPFVRFLGAGHSNGGDLGCILIMNSHHNLETYRHVGRNTTTMFKKEN